MIAVLHKAFQILALLKPDGEKTRRSGAELSRMSGYNLATTHRILQVMKHYGLVYQDPQTKEYALGFSLIQYGALAQNLYSIRDLAKPYMEELKEITGETIYLSLLINNKNAVLIDMVESDERLRIVEPIGLVLPLYIGAAGKVILANMPDHLQHEVIESFTWEKRTDKTIGNADELRKEIETIKKQGYALSFGDTTEGTYGLGAAVFSGSEVTASLTIAGPEVRFSPEKLPRLASALTDRAKQLSQALSG